MRYNPIGDLGAGAGTISVNRQAIGPGFFTSGAWVTPDQFIAHAPEHGTSDPFHLYRYDRSSGWGRIELDPRGATWAGGGGGNWAATLAASAHSPIQTYGQFNGLPLPAWTAKCGVLDGAADGRLLFVAEDYLSIGLLARSGAVTWWPTGQHVNLTTARLVEGGFAYWDQQVPKTLQLQLGIVPPVSVLLFENPGDPWSFTWQGQRWIFYRGEATYLHPIGSALGYQFAASYAPTCFVEPSGVCHVALTSSPGEAPETITLVPPFVLGEGMRPIVPPVEIPAFTHNVAVGVCFPSR